MLAKLLESLIGDSTEFEQVTILIPVEVLGEAQDLAAQIGVPTARLLAELLPPALREARGEWRSVSFGMAPDSEPAPTPFLSVDLPPRVK